MPLVGCHFFEKRIEARHAECGTLDLVLCRECGHIYNRAFEPERIRYAPGYENALSFSPRHRTHLNATVEQLIGSYNLRDKSIVDIGCGDASFLSQLCAQGRNRGIGYDPTQESRTFKIGEGSVEIRSQSFSAIDQDPVDFVCAVHVLEHLHDLRAALRQTRRILKQGGGGYFEVPNGLAIFRDLNIWDLTYEHVSYFSPVSLQRALSDAGLPVLRLESSFGGQYLDADVLQDGPTATTPLPSDDPGDDVKHFPAAFGVALDRWKHRMITMIAGGQRIALWGAGTKSVSFLNMLGIKADDGVEYVVDINPRKIGLFLAGTAQQIVTPQYLQGYQPQIVVVMNSEYLEEIRSMIGSLQLRCELIAATPADR